MSILIVNDTSGKLAQKKGLPVLNQFITWLIFGFIFIPFELK